MCVERKEEVRKKATPPLRLSLRPLLRSARMQEVIPNLFIGDYAASQDVAALEAEGIKAVVSASKLLPALFSPDRKSVV